MCNKWNPEVYAGMTLSNTLTFYRDPPTNIVPLNLSTTYTNITIEVRKTPTSAIVASVEIGDGLTISGASSNVLNLALLIPTGISGAYTYKLNFFVGAALVGVIAGNIRIHP